MQVKQAKSCILDSSAAAQAMLRWDANLCLPPEAKPFGWPRSHEENRHVVAGKGVWEMIWAEQHVPTAQLTADLQGKLEKSV